MRKAVSVAVVAVALVSIPGAGSAAAASSWFHIEVREAEEDQKVEVNLLLGLVERAAGMIPRDLRHRGRVHIDGSRFDRHDLERLREAVAELGPGEATTLRIDRRDVEVSRSGSEIRLHAEAARRYQDDFEVRMPFEVMEAFLGDEEGELDLVAGLKALERHGRSGPIHVEDDDGSSRARIWIDDSPTPR